MTELALATDTAPQPPAVILQLLEKLGLPYQVCRDLPGLIPKRGVPARPDPIGQIVG